MRGDGRDYMEHLLEDSVQGKNKLRVTRRQ
jgi:hypothetical protein